MLPTSPLFSQRLPVRDARKAAYPLRGAFFGAVLLFGLAACSPKSGETTQAAGPASSAPAPEASAALPPGRAETVDQGAAKSRAAVERLIGTWYGTTAGSSGDIDLVWDYAADRSFTVKAMLKGKAELILSAKGTWSVSGDVLRYAMTYNDGSKTSGTFEILRITAAEFVYVDSEDKKTEVVTRSRPARDAAASAAIADNAALPGPAAPAPHETLMVDESLFVANKDVTPFGFTVNEAVQVRLVVEIDEKVPLNVVVLRGKVSSETYIMNLVAIMMGQLAGTTGDGKSLSEADLFASRLSKRAAYGRFESPWVTLPPGPRTIVLDNSGELTPSRGDAPLHLRLYTRPAP